MNVTFAEDGDLELFEKLQGTRIEVSLEGCPVGRFRILGIEQTDDGENVLYAFPANEDWECPGYDRFRLFLNPDMATVLPVDLITDMVIWS